MLDELYDTNDLQPEFVEETEKPYDKYLKLHNYDPKTNTVEIDGKRVNAGARNISSKERNRMNKVLRENDYDPKSGTYKSDIKVKDPKSGEMKNQRVKLNFDTRQPTQAHWSKHRVKGMDWDKSNINIQPSDLRKKPKDAGSTLGHEEGHFHDKNDQDWSGENKSQKIRDIKREARKANENDFKDLRYSKYNAQMDHANDTGEKYADLYGELHNKQGFGGTKMSLNRYKNEDKSKMKLSEEDKKGYAEDLKDLKEDRDRSNRKIDKDRAAYDVISNDEEFDWLLGKKDEAVRRVSRFEKRLEMSPEDRLENELGYSPKEIEDLKKSGKFEDTLKAERMDDEFLKSRMKKYNDEFSGYAEDLDKRRKELLDDENIQSKIKEKVAKEEKKNNDYYDELEKSIYDNIDAEKNYNAEMDSRSNYVERKIRELAEKDPEVKRKLAQYDEAMARRKQKLEKRKANKAEARAREQEARRAQEYTEYYLDDIEITW
jgi:fused signal recognition particle receptor